MVVRARRASVVGEDAARLSTVAAVWRDLNRYAARITTWVGVSASAALLFVGLSPVGSLRVHGLLSALAAAIALTGYLTTKRGAEDNEQLLTVSVAGVVLGGTVAPAPVVMGLWSAVAVLAVIGALLLSPRKAKRFLVFSGLAIAAQITWPVIGLASLGDTLVNLVVSAGCAGVGARVVVVARNALNEAEQRRVEMFRRVPTGLFRTDAEGRVIDANPALTEMLGYSDPLALHGRMAPELYESPDQWYRLAEDLHTTRMPSRFAHRMMTSGGNAIWVRGTAQAKWSETREVEHYDFTIEDVTQRREAEERFRRVFEHAPIAIWEENYSAVGRRLEELRVSGVSNLRAYLKDHPGEVDHLLGLIDFIDVNPAGIALIGAESKEDALRSVLPENVTSAVVDGFIEEFTAIWEDKDRLLIEITGSTAEGDTTDLALSWAAGRGDDGRLDLTRCIVAIQDIAIVKEAERKLAALVESKDELIAAVSHELRTPLTTVVGMALELRDRGDRFTREELTEFVSLIADQSRELANIVEDLLVAARTEADTLSIRPESLDLAREIQQLMRTSTAAPDLMVDTAVIAWADPLRLRQILRNLLSNADRYGGEQVSVEIEAFDQHAVVRVRDTGTGIPEEDRESVFEPYVRSGGDAALPGSLGLGLPVSRRLARLMGGDLVYRFDGTSVFELTLPVAPMARAA